MASSMRLVRSWDWDEGKVRLVPVLPANPLVLILIPCFNEVGSGEPLPAFCHYTKNAN